MPLSDQARDRILTRLGMLYGNAADAVVEKIDHLADRYGELRGQTDPRLWDERAVVLIAYGDQIRSEGRPALQVLDQFLAGRRLQQVIRGVHLLPFFPYSSDDGFSVIDYHAVDAALGDWPDIERLGRSYTLMFDFVLNHCSRQNEWFQRYLRAQQPYDRYFLEVDPAADLSAVTRPRSSPLLTPFKTEQGTRHVWTTFSADQVDLNFACPEVLVEMLDVLLSYVQHGAKVIRLDAVGFLWKRIGTNCMHLPETHAVVKLMRDVLDDLAPGTILLTETNVPHEENVSYFGDGDEAHAVYQFSLAPLLLDAFLSGDAGPFSDWLRSLEDPGPGRTYFNFTASHDGVGVRPLEGLVSEARLDALVDKVRQRGGLVSTRRRPDGSEAPYELNISYFSALDTPEGLSAAQHASKFLTSQAIMLALRGVPGIYFHSLVGTPNDIGGVDRTGENRSINRRKFDSDELDAILARQDSAQRLVFDGYCRMLQVRIGQPAFHPDALQAVVDTGHRSTIGFTRTSQDGGQQVLVLANVGDGPVRIDLRSLTDRDPQQDLLSGQPVSGPNYEIGPCEIAWLK